jgi:hypothetical protein
VDPIDEANQCGDMRRDTFRPAGMARTLPGPPMTARTSLQATLADPPFSPE